MANQYPQHERNKHDESERAAYAKEAEVAIGMIEAQVQQLLADNAPAQWAVDDAPEPDYDEDWSDYEEAA